MVHPDDSILLAYTRRQSLGEDRPGIQYHIDNCKRCCQRCNEYAQISTELSATLKHFQYNQYYPPLAEGIIEYIQNPSAARLARQRREHTRRKPYVMRGKRLSVVSFRGVVISLAVLLLVFLFMAIVFAGRGVPLLNHNWHFISVTQTSSFTTVKAHMVSPTVAPHGSPTVPATLTSGTSHPAIRLCPIKSNKFLSRMGICGYNFTPGDKVELMAQTVGGTSRTPHVVTVDAQGSFQDFWAINTCNDYPITISVKDLTHESEVVPELQNNQLGRCLSQNHTQ